MAEDRSLRPLKSYLEFGYRLHVEEFSQITAAVLLVYLPVAALALLLHPPVRAFLEPADVSLALIPKMLVAQVLLRLGQVFVFIVLILHVEARRKGEDGVWDVAEAAARFKLVTAVDFAYAFGLQLLAVVTLWGSLTVTGAFLGRSPLALPLAFSATAFLVIAPAVRFYFCSMSALLERRGFAASFQAAARISAGAERTIVALTMFYLLAWFLLWQVIYSAFGGGFLGQLMLQAAVMVVSVSYFLAGYAIFLDLTPRSIRSGGESSNGTPAEADEDAYTPPEEDR